MGNYDLGSSFAIEIPLTELSDYPNFLQDWNLNSKWSSCD